MSAVVVTREDWELLLGKEESQRGPRDWNTLMCFFHNIPSGTARLSYYSEKDIARMAKWLTDATRGADRDIETAVHAVCAMAKFRCNRSFGNPDTDQAAGLLLANIGQFLVRILPPEKRAKVKPKKLGVEDIAHEIGKSTKILMRLVGSMRRQELAKKKPRKRAA